MESRFVNLSSVRFQTRNMSVLTLGSLFLLLSHVICISQGANVRHELPVIKIFEIRATTSTKLEFGEEEHLVEKLPNSNIVVGEDVRPNSKLILECDARYPVQWVYQGEGMPEYSTNTTQTQTTGGITRPDNLFAASISLGFRRPISVHDSGRYTCRSLQNPELAVYYYLYVSDGKVFVNPEGETIYFKRADDSVRIPCIVSNPKAAVSLQKSINGLVSCPLNESITYDSTKGFQLKVSHHFDPAGTYLCTGGLNNTYQVVKYTLVRETQDQPTTNPSQTKDTCIKNSDCSSTHACIQSRNGYSCSSPCGNVCGRNTQCEVVNHIPRCQCLPGHAGDPYQACFVNIKPETIEQSDPCTPSPCGLNTICERHGGIARCSCAAGFQGDPYSRCHPYQKRDPCDPNPCGSNSVCTHRNGFTSCSCRPGYYGQPPYCRAECEVSTHCPSDRACFSGRCRNPCEGACVSFRRTECRVINRQPVCATINCLPGYFGRDCLSIYTKQDGQIRVPERLGEAASSSTNYLPPSPPSSSQDQEVSPCTPFPCGLNAECVVKRVANTMLNVTGDIALCQCPPKLTGNADIECFPIEEQLRASEEESSEESSVEDDDQSDTPSVTAIVETPTTTTTTTTTENTNKVVPYLPSPSNNTIISYQCTPECGINAKCLGKNSCSCPTKFSGNPYIKCYPISCITVGDCDNINAACIDGKCVEQGSPADVTVKHCGINAINVVADGKSSCICPANFTGIATIACHQITSNEIINTTTTTTTTIPTISSSSTTAEEPQQLENSSSSTSSICNECGKNTQCILTINNTQICQCVKPFEGNPVIGCELKCKNNSDCPTHQLCHETSNLCINPCDAEHQPFFVQCGRNAACKVKDHVPLCYCPEKFAFGSPNIHCKEDALMSDSRMPNRTCVDEKRFNCGPNSECKRFHDFERCVCSPGTFGDPTDSDLGCNIGIECRKNEQCKNDEECVNGKCLSVCRHRNRCGPLAGCKADEHKFSCICHIGTLMNPSSGECEAAKGALAERLLFFRSFEDV